MKTSTRTTGAGSLAQRENVKAALAAALNGLNASKAGTPVPVPEPPSPVLNGLIDSSKLLAEAQVALRAAVTVSDLAAVFDVLQPGRDRSRSKRLAYWVARLGSTPLVEVTTEQVDAVLAELEHQPGERGKVRAGGTVNRYRAALASLVKFARRHRRLPRVWPSPLADLPQHKESPGRLRYLNDDEEKRLMAAASLQRWALLPLVIRMAIVTGLRKGALNALTWADVDWDAKVAKVGRTKNGDAHHAPLTPDLAAALQAVKPARALPHHLIFGGKNPNVAHNYTHAFAKAVRDARIEPITFHGLRHTSCSRLAQAGRSLLEIADHAGHRNLATTRRYSHLSTKGRAQMIGDVFS